MSSQRDFSLFINFYAVLMTITASVTQQVWTLLKEKYISCWIQQPKRDKTSAAPYPQVQPAVRLMTYAQQAYAQRAHMYTILCIYMAGTQISHPSGWHVISFTPGSPVAGTQAHGPSGRQDRLCQSGARRGQTNILTSELFTPEQIFLSIYLSHTCCSPNHRNLSLSLL